MIFWRVQILNIGIYAGLIVCLLWNFIAVTIAWINGEGCLRTFLYSCLNSFDDVPLS